MNKKFVGYFIIGAKTKEEAQKGKGLKAWSTKKPNIIVRFFNRILLNIRWVDSINTISKKYEPKREHPKEGPKRTRRSTSRRSRD